MAIRIMFLYKKISETKTKMVYELKIWKLFIVLVLLALSLLFGIFFPLASVLFVILIIWLVVEWIQAKIPIFAGRREGKVDSKNLSLKYIVKKD